METTIREAIEENTPETPAPLGYEDIEGELNRVSARLNAVWKHCRVVFYPSVDDPRGNYPLEHAPGARKDMRSQIEGRLEELARPTQETNLCICPGGSPDGPLGWHNNCPLHGFEGRNRALDEQKAGVPNYNLPPWHLSQRVPGCQCDGCRSL